MQPESTASQRPPRKPWRLGLLALLVLLTVVCVLGWQLLKATRFSLSELWGHVRELRQQQQRTRDLVQRLDQQNQRSAIKEAIAARLVAGDSSLVETVERFRDLVRDERVFWWEMAKKYRNLPPEEALQRYVIDYTLSLAEERGKSAQVRERLQRELEERSDPRRTGRTS